MEQKNNIFTFQNREEFDNFIISKGLLRKIGEGSEGRCFLSPKEQKTYKILFNGIEEVTGVYYNPNKIITTKDIELKHFFLPEELYAIKEKLIAYKTKYALPDLFTFDRLGGNPNDLYKINFDTLLKAYYKILKETEKLSNEQIKIYDLINNLMFTGTKLIGIDTCGYERVESKTVRDMSLSEFNANILREAIKEVFYFWIKNSDKILPEIKEELYEEEDIEKYVRKLKKQVNLTK